ncbi:MAG: hypothetical protein MJ187_04170 [Alphaproteobacteria bacterium]|nr:hypothetical protein [Alphaproteobacteria bacterium]
MKPKNSITGIFQDYKKMMRITAFLNAKRNTDKQISGGDWRKHIEYSTKMENFIINDTKKFITKQIENTKTTNLKQIRRLVNRIAHYLSVYKMREVKFDNPPQPQLIKQKRTQIKKLLIKTLYTELPAVNWLRKKNKTTTIRKKTLVYIELLSVNQSR